MMIAILVVCIMCFSLIGNILIQLKKVNEVNQLITENQKIIHQDIVQIKNTFEYLITEINQGREIVIDPNKDFH